MHQIRIDTSKNRLYIELASIETVEESEELVFEILSHVKRLKKGFTCLTDLRHFHVGPNTGKRFMQEIQEILWDGGIRLVARLRPEGFVAEGYDLESRSAVWPGYEVLPAESVEEAERLLDESAAEKTEGRSATG